MLVLSRKSGEAVQIAGTITVTVLSVRGNRVRLGIEAPADVRIIRGEINESLALSAGSVDVVECENSAVSA